MKVIKARIRWMEGCANDARLEIWADRVPYLEEMRYERRGNLFFAEQDGYVHFLSENQRDRNGYGGRSFSLTMKDGSEIVLRGPWSSRAAVMEGAGFTPCLEAHLTDESLAYERGHTFVAGAVTLNLAEQALKLVEQYQGHFEDLERYGETYHVIVPNDPRFKRELLARGGGKTFDHQRRDEKPTFNELSADQAKIVLG